MYERVCDYDVHHHELRDPDVLVPVLREHDAGVLLHGDADQGRDRGHLLADHDVDGGVLDAAAEPAEDDHGGAKSKYTSDPRPDAEHCAGHKSCVAIVECREH